MRSLIGLVLVSLLSAGCWGGDEGASIEFASVDGEKWPLRGSLAEETEVRQEVTEVMVPVGADVVTDEPGLFVMRVPGLPEEPIEFSFWEGDQEHDVSVIPPGG